MVDKNLEKSVETKEEQVQEELNLVEHGKFFTDEEREKKIKTELRKLKKLIKNLDKDKKNVAMPLIENIAFCVVQLEELRAIVKRDGYFEKYQNGANQHGFKKSVASDMINQVGKTYTTLLGRLKDFLPMSGEGYDLIAAFEKKHKLK